MTKKNILKYFTIELKTAKDWDLLDYGEFLLDTTYSILIPFFIGFLIARTDQILWVFFLIVPIYFKFKIAKQKTPRKKKKVFFK